MSRHPHIHAVLAMLLFLAITISARTFCCTKHLSNGLFYQLGYVYHNLDVVPETIVDPSYNQHLLTSPGDKLWLSRDVYKCSEKFEDLTAKNGLHLAYDPLSFEPGKYATCYIGVDFIQGRLVDPIHYMKLDFMNNMLQEKDGSSPWKDIAGIVKQKYVQSMFQKPLLGPK